MGKKFKKRFRGLCPCTKTSLTSEVEDAGKSDTRCKGGKEDDKPKPQTVKARPQSLSKFNMMILEIEAMYANITDKLDQRHKSLHEFAKFIFGEEYTNTTVKQVDASVIPNKSKCDTPLREETQEIKHTTIDSQCTGNVQSLEEKERKDDNKDKEKSKRPTFSDRILYRWMTKHLQASNENEANVVETPSKTAGIEIINDEKPTHDEIGPVVYVIDRVFMVDPRIDLVTEVQKAGNPGDVYMGSVHKKGKSFNVEKANVAWRFRTIPARVSDFTISQEKYQVETSVTIANAFESHYISDRSFISDYHQVHGTVAERNKPLNPFLTSQQFDMHGNGQQMMVSLAFGHQTQTHLHATMFGKSQLIQIAVPFDILIPMCSTNKHIQISSALSQLATTRLQDQIHIHVYKQVMQIISAFIHRFSVGPKAKMHDSKEVMQISSAVNHIAPLSHPDHIPGYTQSMIISLDVGQVPIGVRDQIPGLKQVVILSIPYGQPASLDFRAQITRTKDRTNLSITPFGHLARISPRAQLPGKRQLMQTFQASDNHSQMWLQGRISGYNKQVMQISAPFGFRAAIDPGALVPEHTTQVQIFKVMQISLAASQLSSIAFKSLKPGTKQQMKIFTTSDKLASIGLRIQLPSTEHLKQRFKNVGSLAPIDVRAQKPEILPIGNVTPAIGQLVSSSPRAQNPGNEEYEQICQAFKYLALTCLRTLAPEKDGMGEISVVGSPLLTRLRVQKSGNMELGQHSIALECVAPTGLQTGSIRSKQIGLDHLAIGHIAATAQRSEKHKTQQMGQIVLATNGDLGHLSLPFGQSSQTSLRTRVTGSDHKVKIISTFDCRAPFHQHAPKLGYKQPGQICVVFRHLSFTSHSAEQTWIEPMKQNSLVSGHLPLILKIENDHLGQIFLTLGNRSQITQRGQQVRNTQLRQIFLALTRMPLTSFFAQISGNTNLGKSAAQDYFALTGLRADTRGAVLQTCSAISIDASSSMSAPNIHIPNIHIPNIHIPNIHIPNIHIPNISGYISLVSSRSTFAILKEDNYPLPNVDCCRTSTAVETLTRPNIFEGNLLAVEIVFQVSPARDRVFSLEMKTYLPICNDVGPSHQIGELSSLVTATRQPSVGPY